MAQDAKLNGRDVFEVEAFDPCILDVDFLDPECLVGDASNLRWSGVDTFGSFPFNDGISPGFNPHFIARSAFVMAV